MYMRVRPIAASATGLQPEPAGPTAADTGSCRGLHSRLITIGTFAEGLLLCAKFDGLDTPFVPGRTTKQGYALAARVSTSTILGSGLGCGLS